MNFNPQILPHPIARQRYQSIPRAALGEFAASGMRVEEKMDGCWAARELAGALVIGEAMADGRFYAFDCVRRDGRDLRALPLRERLGELDALGSCASFLRPEFVTGSCEAFFESILARGGEGVVLKDLDAPYGDTLLRCKRVETFDLVVTGKDEWTGSLELAEITGEKRGRVPAKKMFDKIRVGDVVEVAAFSLTAKGLLREPRFVRIREEAEVF